MRYDHKSRLKPWEAMFRHSRPDPHLLLNIVEQNFFSFAPRETVTGYGNGSNMLVEKRGLGDRGVTLL